MISLQPSFFPATLAGFVLYTIYKLFFVKQPPPDYFKLSGVPRPTPRWDFDIDKAKARPYRPFRWEYNQTMSLEKLDPDYWLELESTYRARIAQRKALYAQHGPSILAALPGTHNACVELAEMVIQFLCVRYPRHFHLTPSGVFHNHILGTHSPVPVLDSAAEDTGLEALKLIFEHVPEDFLVMQRDAATGLYVLRGGIACSALGWTLGEKLGQPLHEVHTNVPDYKEKMQFSIDRYFTKLACDKPIQRGAWSLEIGQPLFAPPGDAAFFGLRNAPPPTLAIEDVFLRVDWQILRRLPVSDAIVFNYKALFTPATALRDEPYIPRLLAKIMRDMKPSLKEYKGTGHVEHCVLPKLDEWAREQEEKGWVPRDWKERTLNEDPFFPGWNDNVAPHTS
ncbi:hypothetical protein DXG03_002026 [Asterophora parasitica]|uniref:Uncharacterized protein n=1 Tax=Asterophora parasitica TaxID=117018 RepID=A0A9P7G2T1_9AGAR|nr:hypothetical protein DXG03_002026 [Asterophora parasitica]